MREYICEIYEFNGLWHAGKMREKVVRCRYCKYYKPEEWYPEDRGLGVVERLYEPPSCANPRLCGIHVNEDGSTAPLRVLAPGPDDFCAWAERKVDA